MEKSIVFGWQRVKGKMKMTRREFFTIIATAVGFLILPQTLFAKTHKMNLSGCTSNDGARRLGVISWEPVNDTDLSGYCIEALVHTVELGLDQPLKERRFIRDVAKTESCCVIDLDVGERIGAVMISPNTTLWINEL